MSFGLRTDRMALSEEISACLRLGRRLVNEDLVAPAYRDADGRSRARLLNGAATVGPSGATSRTAGTGA